MFAAGRAFDGRLSSFSNDENDIGTAARSYFGGAADATARVSVPRLGNQCTSVGFDVHARHQATHADATLPRRMLDAVSKPPEAGLGQAAG